MQCTIIPWLKTSNRALVWENDNVRSRLGADRELLNNYTKCNYIFHLPYILNKLHIKSKPKSVFHIGTTDTNQNSICESLTQWSVMSKNCLTVLTEVQLTSPHSTHYRHTKHMLPHNHDGLIILFKYFNSF